MSEQITNSQLVNDFNTQCIDLVKFVGQISPNSTIANNVDYIEKLAKNKKTFLIEQFINHVLVFKPKIDEADENFFMTHEFKDEAAGDSDVISKVFEFKSIWKKLTKDNQKGVTTCMQILCYYAELYFLKNYN